MGVGELRAFIFLDRLQPQTMCYLGSWIRGSLPRSNDAAIVVEVAPGLDVEPLTDVAPPRTKRSSAAALDEVREVCGKAVITV